MADFFLILFMAIILIEVFFYPRLDFTGGQLLLWYGIRARKFVVLWNFNK